MKCMGGNASPFGQVCGIYVAPAHISGTENDAENSCSVGGAVKRAFLVFVLLLWGQTAAAVSLSTWSGPGPNACRGNCSLDWAKEQLTNVELAELEAAMTAHPEPEPVIVDDGTVFSMMSYQKDGVPYAYRTYTVALLSDPETARGWHMAGWSFVQLDACDNWAIIKQGETGPTLATAPADPDQDSIFQPGPTPTGDGITLSRGIPTSKPRLFAGDPDGPLPNPPLSPGPTDKPVSPDPVIPVPVPLPASVLLMLAGLGSLNLARRWRRAPDQRA